MQKDAPTKNRFGHCVCAEHLFHTQPQFLTTQLSALILYSIRTRKEDLPAGPFPFTPNKQPISVLLCVMLCYYTRGGPFFLFAGVSKTGGVQQAGLENGNGAVETLNILSITKKGEVFFLAMLRSSGGAFGF